MKRNVRIVSLLSMGPIATLTLARTVPHKKPKQHKDMTRRVSRSTCHGIIQRDRDTARAVSRTIVRFNQMIENVTGNLPACY